MDFDGYFKVLSSAAENYDDKVGSTVHANTRCASMNVAERKNSELIASGKHAHY
jgi:hypothetical protein